VDWQRRLRPDVEPRQHRHHDLNLAADATYDPKTKNIWKFKGLYLRGDTNGELAVDRLLFEVRNERDLSERVYLFGQLQFLKDHFKNIDYLWSPNGGIGYRLIVTPTTTLSADAGFGVKWEKNTGMDVRTDAVFTSSDMFEQKLSATASITQGFNPL
jgi:putative salt-induced outer membrane protein YdiY